MRNPKALGVIVLLAVSMIPLMSCTTSLKNRYEGTTYDIAITAKDFEVLGVVRVETTVNQGNGAFITYDSLLKAAEDKGGNGIVNVMIDKKVTTTTFFGLYPISSSDTYYGTALAIKYTNTAAPNAPLSTSNTKVVGKEAATATGDGKKGLFGLGIGPF
jgi:hypothetical protein